MQQLYMDTKGVSYALKEYGSYLKGTKLVYEMNTSKITVFYNNISDDNELLWVLPWNNRKINCSSEKGIQSVLENTIIMMNINGYALPVNFYAMGETYVMIFRICALLMVKRLQRKCPKNGYYCLLNKENNPILVENYLNVLWNMLRYYYETGQRSQLIEKVFERSKRNTGRKVVTLGPVSTKERIRISKMNSDDKPKGRNKKFNNDEVNFIIICKLRGDSIRSIQKSFKERFYKTISKDTISRIGK